MVAALHVYIQGCNLSKYLYREKTVGKEVYVTISVDCVYWLVYIGYQNIR